MKPYVRCAKPSDATRVSSADSLSVTRSRAPNDRRNGDAETIPRPCSPSASPDALPAVPGDYRSI